jgi:phthiocerol/phenolphthiocerol synthesis type-I polyketide synthase A
MTESPPVLRSAEEIRDWITERLVSDVGLSPDEVDADKPVVSFGVDSMQFVVLVGELEAWLGVRFADNPLIDHPTINALSDYLARQLALGLRVIDPTADL